MPEIPLNELSRSLDPIRHDIDAAIKRVVDSGWFLRGPETVAFEEEWAAYCGQSYAVACNSGTDALTIAALALGLRSVQVQANTLPLTALGLGRSDAAVRLADVGSDGRLLDPADDCVPVLLFGREPSPCETKARLFDAAHAHGWHPPAQASATWSFYPTKTLGALGDGGAVTTNDRDLAEEMRRLCSRDDAFRDPRQITSRLDEVQAAVLRVKLRHLDACLDQRREIAQHYDRRLAEAGITIPGPSLNHLYVVRVQDRDNLANFLRERHVQTKVHWATPLNTLQGPWSRAGTYQAAEQWCGEILSLPCFPGLRPDEIDYICDLIATWLLKNQPISG